MRNCAFAMAEAQGSQYATTRFLTLVAHYQALPSRIRRVNCYDNAHAESF
jgi:transposase InsO family protein